MSPERPTAMVWKAALRPCLRRVAFFAESHSIKGWLAAQRLLGRFPSLEAALADPGEWNQLLAAPEVEGAIGARVSWDRASLTEARLVAMLRGAVFPMAYLAAVELGRRHGLGPLFERDTDQATRRLSGLGHAYTIHESFRAVVPHLRTEEERELCAERYAELVASQLLVNDASRDDRERPLDGPEIDPDAVVAEVLARPGYLGHALIALGVLARRRHELDEPRRRYVLHRLREMAKDSAHDARGIAVDRGTEEPDEESLERAVGALLREGPREVHTLTLADAGCAFWDANLRWRRQTEEALLRFSKVRLERATSGERERG